MSNLLFNNNLLYRGTRHLLFFTVTVCLFAGILYVQTDSGNWLDTLQVTFINSLFFFGYAYITIFLLIPEFLIKQKVFWFLLIFVLVGVGLSALKLVFSETIFYSTVSPENVPKEGFINLRFIVVNTKDMSFIVALFCIAKYVKDYLYAEQIRKKLERQNKEAKGKLLQSQFDPHFLFNTINNLYALSLLNPKQTREIIKQIKIVLRYIIDESQKDFVSLQDEVVLVENYIQLEKLRYGKRLKVTFHPEGNTADIQIPPMILFFLVENCFKHGSSLDAGVPWIKINVKAGESEILLITENSKPKTLEGQWKPGKSGQSLKNLTKRLAIIYGENGFDLKIDNSDNSFKVELKLKTEIEYRQNTYR